MILTSAVCGSVQIAFMQRLMAEGVADKRDVVFLDMDVLVVDSLAEVSYCSQPVHGSHLCSSPMEEPSNVRAQRHTCERLTGLKVSARVS